MRCEWVLILGAGLCGSLVPACQPLVRQTAPNDLPASPTAEREQPADESRAGATAGSPYHPGSANPAVKTALAKETSLEQARYPGTPAEPDLIPQPPSLAEASAPAKPPLPPEHGTEVGSPADPEGKPADDPPLVEALRCFLDRRPDEAVAWLDRYDKPSQELLLCLLPLAVRLTEGSWQRYDAREAGTVVAQLDRVSALLRPRAELSIQKMCFCSRIESYGCYVPIPDSHGFQPGELAVIYVELQNLSDQRHGNAYRIHLASTVEIRDFNGQGGWRYNFPNRFQPDLSQSERHDFYNRYRFRVPKIPPGLYTLYLQIADVHTGRTAHHTLDFRVVPASAKGEW